MRLIIDNDEPWTNENVDASGAGRGLAIKYDDEAPQIDDAPIVRENRSAT